MMQRALLAAILVLLVMCNIAAAESKHVDGGWQRSDDAPEATPIASPENACNLNASVDGHIPSSESSAWWTVWSMYAWVLAAVLFALTALWLWLRGAKR
jgi:hypothetical protein